MIDNPQFIDEHATQRLPAVLSAEETLAELTAQIRALQQTQWHIIVVVCLLFLVVAVQTVMVYGAVMNAR